MADPAYRYRHERARAGALRELRDGTPCELCGEAMTRAMKLDYDHEVPLALGGDPRGRKRLTHASCNRRAGAQLRNSLARARKAAAAVVQLPEGASPGWFDVTDPGQPSRRSQQWHERVVWLGPARV